MSRRSRKRTDAEATVMAIPATKRVCRIIRNGTRSMVALRVMSPCKAKPTVAMSRMGIASTKCTRCDATVTSGNASAGNITFLISPAFDEIDDVDSRTAAEKNVQGRIPEKRNSGYGWMRADGKKKVKTIV